MDGKALGLVETFGLVPAIEGADAAVKSADVELRALEMIGAGLITIVIVGDISAVSAAVDAGKAAAEQLGTVLSTTVIGRTGEGLETVLGPQLDPDKPVLVVPKTEPASQAVIGTVPGSEAQPPRNKALEAAPQVLAVSAPDLAAEPVEGNVPGKEASVKQTMDLAALRNMSVVKLRQFARKLPGLPLAQKKIKYARKKELIEAIVEYHRHEEK
ncbi:MAG: BMC domain-containing protein [Desulfobacterium sp.]|nr:BMC domain-containing protein [Desulfobacterium sp.]